MGIKSALALAVLGLGAVSSAHAGVVVNGSFEDGLTNWSALMPTSVSVVSSATAQDGTEYLATAGSHFALMTGAGITLSYLNSSLPATDGSTLLGGVTIDAGQALSFDWAFLGKDYMPFNDSAGVLMFGSVDGTAFNQSYTLASISTVGNYGDSGWQTFSVNPGGSFVGAIQFYVANNGDSGLPSQFALDNVHVAAVPEPETYAMLLTGLALIGGMARRRMKS